VRNRSLSRQPIQEHRVPWPWLVETFELDDNSSSENHAPTEAAR